jgi:hypothetical protein
MRRGSTRTDCERTVGTQHAAPAHARKPRTNTHCTRRHLRVGPAAACCLTNAAMSTLLHGCARCVPHHHGSWRLHAHRLRLRTVAARTWRSYCQRAVMAPVDVLTRLMQLQQHHWRWGPRVPPARLARGTRACMRVRACLAACARVCRCTSCQGTHTHHMHTQMLHTIKPGGLAPPSRGHRVKLRCGTSRQLPSNTGVARPLFVASAADFLPHTAPHSASPVLYTRLTPWASRTRSRDHCGSQTSPSNAARSTWRPQRSPPSPTRRSTQQQPSAACCPARCCPWCPQSRVSGWGAWAGRLLRPIPGQSPAALALTAMEAAVLSVCGMQQA